MPTTTQQDPQSHMQHPNMVSNTISEIPAKPPKQCTAIKVVPKTNARLHTILKLWPNTPNKPIKPSTYWAKPQQTRHNNHINKQMLKPELRNHVWHSGRLTWLRNCGFIVLVFWVCLVLWHVAGNLDGFALSVSAESKLHHEWFSHSRLITCSQIHAPTQSTEDSTNVSGT